MVHPALLLAGSAAASARTASFAVTDVLVRGQSVPVALWYPYAPLPETWRRRDAYEYDIDVGRIALKLEVEWLSWLPARHISLPRVEVQSRPPAPPASGAEALIFAHGFLGSQFDMAHACEALAADGFIVAAPELPESLSASYDARGITRADIVTATQRAIDAGLASASSPSQTTAGAAPSHRCHSPSHRWGIFGHSAGSATAILQPGEFALGRACLATAIGRCLETRTPDPLFVVASEGDSCHIRMQQKGVTLPRTAITLARVSGSPRFTAFEGAADAYASGGLIPRRGVLVFERGRDSLLPNHISFLWQGTNEAMFELLTPLLPLARALDLFLLDFDTEMEARLAGPTAAQLVPALRRFFGAWREASGVVPRAQQSGE